jgi:hypothetical protein
MNLTGARQHIDEQHHQLTFGDTQYLTITGTDLTDIVITNMIFKARIELKAA